MHTDIDLHPGTLTPRAVIDTFFHVDISEVNYATC